MATVRIVDNEPLIAKIADRSRWISSDKEEGSTIYKEMLSRALARDNWMGAIVHQSYIPQ